MDQIIAKLKSHFPAPLHGRVFLVGGMVRDILSGVACQDIDLAAAVSPHELAPLGFRLVESKSTPNIYFWFSKHLGKVELTLLPSMDALLEDLQRRDFTVNAMAMTLDQVLTDPLGGREDLEHRILRTCSATSLRDDPARIFRAFRFECDGWRLDAAAEAELTSRDWNEELNRLPVERFTQEMLKALAKPDPVRFFSRLLQFGVARDIIPEMFLMPEVPAGPLEHHPEGDLFTHSMQVLERMCRSTPDPAARFCALFHDLGKLSTAKELYPRHHGHDRAGAAAAPSFCKRLRLPLVLQRALQATCRLHNTANRWGELRDSTKIELALDARKGGIEEILPLVVAADLGGPLTGWEAALRVAALNSAQLGIDPKAFLDEQPGKGGVSASEKLQQVIMQRRVEELRKG
jgi:tRNA nucleotidyltransferase (CCA-adding enzyme)